jgi:hypothetical protein
MNTTQIKPTKRNALAAIAKISASLDTDGSSYAIDAPKGYVFNANNEHTYFVGYYDLESYDPVTMPKIWEHTIETAEMGVRECDGSQCSNAWDWHEGVKYPEMTLADYERALRYHIASNDTERIDDARAKIAALKAKAVIAA